ncbi:FAD-binding protein [Candidatus Uabimicrobium sp. HlEnr_7]|uniref:FAD-binding protein n=1 Tax=Candidatus Uabimicrobium helgolandensis TaxID=3095367 RepID=UPI0035577BF1
MDKYLHLNVIKKFDNLEQLANHYRLPHISIDETVKEYNHFVDCGKDKQFGKNIPQSAQSITPPFYTIRLWPKVHYAMGGLKINDCGQVLDKDNQPIPKLYAAGEATGGVHGASRLSTCSIIECLVFGRIVGANVKKRN